MKKLNQMGIGLVIIAILGVGNGPARADSIVQITAEAQGLQQIPPEQVPPVGTFWQAAATGLVPVPFPCPPWGSGPIYQIADGQYLADGTVGQSMSEAAMESEATAVVNLIQQIEAIQVVSQPNAMARAMTADAVSPPSPGDGGSGGGDASVSNNYPGFTFNTNLLWLQITNVSNGTAFANLHHATNQVYAIWSTPDLTVPFSLWPVETEVFPTNSTTNILSFTVPTSGRQNLFLRAQDWTGVYANGLPCWWTWYYFHTLDLTWTNEDANGVTLGDDYTNGYDPNTISFEIVTTNTYVNKTNPLLSLDVLSGFPGFAAVLVNDANHAHAVWQSYIGSDVAPSLGTDGTYTVSVGLRGFVTNAMTSWQNINLVKDTVAPQLTITNPLGNTATHTPIQFSGYANEALNWLTFDLVNFKGTFTNQEGFLTGLWFDSSRQAYTTNGFQSDDVDLGSGTNLITIHAMDWAGNQTNFSIIINYQASTNPPVVSILWPAPGTSVGGSAFTVKAQLDSATTTISASTTGGTVPGMVERDGTAWIQNVPLNAGANNIALTATDSNGRTTVTNITVYENDVGLVIYPLSDSQLNESSVTVNGRIRATNLQVYINGAAASVKPSDGTWQASAVSVNPSGTAVLDAEAYDGGSTPVASQILYQPQPVTIELMSYSGHHGILAGGETYKDNINWFYNVGGKLDDIDGKSYQITAATNGTGYILNYPGWGGMYYWNVPLDALPLENASITATFPGYMDLYENQTQARVMIVPGSQTLAGTTNLYLVLAQASEFSDTNLPNEYYGGYTFSGYSLGDVPLPPEWLKVRGQPLVNTGLTNILSSTSDDVWGATVVGGPAGKNLDVTPVATRVYHNWDYTFDAQAYQVGLKILDANTKQDLTLQTNTVIVGQQMNLLCQLSITNAFMTNFVLTNFSWTVPGYAVTNFYVSPDALWTNGRPALLNATNTQNANFWWADSATGRVVQCSATFNGVPVAGQAIFNISKPTAKITATTSSIRIGLDISGEVFRMYFGEYLGTNVDAIPGIQFSNTITMPPGANYNYGNTNYSANWVQLITAASSSLTAYGTNHTWQSSGTVLDTQYPASDVADSMDDSPGISLEEEGETAASKATNFKTWVMFKPAGGGWVPLRIVNWNIDCAASLSGTNWILSRANWSTNPPDADAGTNYPIWTDNVANTNSFSWHPPF